MGHRRHHLWRQLGGGIDDIHQNLSAVHQHAAAVRRLRRGPQTGQLAAHRLEQFSGLGHRSVVHRDVCRFVVGPHLDLDAKPIGGGLGRSQGGDLIAGRFGGPAPAGDAVTSAGLSERRVGSLPPARSASVREPGRPRAAAVSSRGGAIDTAVGPTARPLGIALAAAVVGAIVVLVVLVLVLVVLVVVVGTVELVLVAGRR